MVTSERKEDPMLANYDIKNYGACHQWRTSKSTCSRPNVLSAVNLKDPAFRSLGSSRHTLQRMDALKKRGQGLRSWIRVDAAGNSRLKSSKSTSLP
ncbi:hypothetical protein SLA2020_243750 [Shorea laevis]